MNLKITKRLWIFLSFVHVFKSDARVKRTRLNVCTTTTTSSSSSSKGSRRSLVAHENRRGFSPRLRASFLRRRRRLEVVSVFFSFKLLLEKGLVFSRARFRRGLPLGARRTKSRYPALCAFPVLRFRSARRRVRAHRLERETEIEKERERTRRIFFPFFSWNLLFEFSLLLSLEQTRRRCRRKEAATRTWKHQQQPNG